MRSYRKGTPLPHLPTSCLRHLQPSPHTPRMGPRGFGGQDSGKDAPGTTQRTPSVSVAVGMTAECRLLLTRCQSWSSQREDRMTASIQGLPGSSKREGGQPRPQHNMPETNLRILGRGTDRVALVPLPRSARLHRGPRTGWGTPSSTGPEGGGRGAGGDNPRWSQEPGPPGTPTQQRREGPCAGPSSTLIWPRCRPKSRAHEAKCILDSSMNEPDPFTPPTAHADLSG